jgi:hypothetical protein
LTVCAAILVFTQIAARYASRVAVGRLGARGAGRRPALVWPFGVRANAGEFGAFALTLRAPEDDLHRIRAFAGKGRTRRRSRYWARLPDYAKGYGAPSRRKVMATTARPTIRLPVSPPGGSFCGRFAERSDLLNFDVSYG